MKMRTVFFISFLLAYSPPSRGFLAEKTVGIVGEEFIPLSTFRLYKKRLRAGLIYEGTLFKIVKKKELLSNDKKLVSFLLEDLMISQIAKTEEFEPTKEQVEQALKRIQGKRGGVAFSEKLSRQSYTLKKLREDLRQDLKKDFIVRQAIFSKIKISEEDINAYHFKKKRRSLYNSFEYEFSFTSLPRTKKGIKQGRQLLSLLKTSPSPLASFQKKTLRSRQMDPQMERALKNLSVSKTSSLIPIKNRLYIFKLHWKAPVLTPSQEKTKRNIESVLIEKEIKKELHKWLEKQKKHFFIQANFP